MFKHLISLKQSPQTVNLFIVVFYCVGIAGFIIPATNSLFIKLIPIALLLSFVLLWVFHDTQITQKSLLILSTIFIGGFLIEAVGVNTGLVFGNYTYDTGLGIKIFETPLIIGLNWLFLVYTSTIIVDNIKTTGLIKIVLASGVMVIYDAVLEPMASKLNMWYWENDVIPLQNYIAWFILAFLFHLLIKVGHIKLKNRIAAFLFVCQLLFFVVLYIVSKLIL